VPAYIIFTDRTLIEMAEKRPESMDDMAHISGLGTKKLASYGQIFLSVITGTTDTVHPARMRLAGQPAGDLYDRLLEAQNVLSRGEDGTGKYLSCTTTTLRKIAETRPATESDLIRIQGMGEQKAERFGVEFLRLVAETAG
jgi:ATP-dependent DNA helicase RecQ